MYLLSLMKASNNKNVMSVPELVLQGVLGRHFNLAMPS